MKRLKDKTQANKMSLLLDLARIVMKPMNICSMGKIIRLLLLKYILFEY